jgi:hypothetical protein
LLPLVVGVYQDGPFRVAVALWAGTGTTEPVDRFERLEALLGAWDGRFVKPRAWIAAQDEARRQARERVDAQRKRAAERERQGLERQIAAARLRLVRELARYLLCLDSDAADLNAILHAQLGRDIASAARLGRVYERVGYPEWDNYLVEELRQQVRGLTAGQQESVLLGKPLDAALDDPRWIATKTLTTRFSQSSLPADKPLEPLC